MNPYSKPEVEYVDILDHFLPSLEGESRPCVVFDTESGADAEVREPVEVRDSTQKTWLLHS